MDRIETSAQISVARGSGFGLLAIVCTMAGLMGTPAVALKAGGILCLLASFILLIKAQHAPTRPYKRTEVWLMLAPADRPPTAVAQQIIGNALRGAFRAYALHYARAAAVALSLGLVLALT